MEMSNEQLKKLKKIELDIMKEFIFTCQKFNLKYYIVGGTLLGAVRHHGFIPWDDDIDIAMPREDYEMFLTKATNELPSHYFVQTIETDLNYLQCFGKIRNSNTTFIESSASHLDINHGIFIDIFPLDYYPEEKSKQNRLEIMKKIYSYRVSCCFNKNIQRSLVDRAKSGLILLLYPNINKVLRKREKLYKSVPESHLWVNNGGAWGQKEIVPIEWFEEGIDVKFEGLTVKAPKEYDKLLTQVYGDYMKLPPIEKQCGHHYIDVIDFDNSYTKYTKN